MGDEPFDYAKYSNLPGWSLSKCKKLHEKHIADRKNKEVV
jgi:hypothetical protein